MLVDFSSAEDKDDQPQSADQQLADYDVTNSAATPLVKARSPKKYTHAEALNGFRPIYKQKGVKRDKPAYSDNFEPEPVDAKGGTAVKAVYQIDSYRPQYETGYSRPSDDYGAETVHVSTTTAGNGASSIGYGTPAVDNSVLGPGNSGSGSACGASGSAYGAPGSAYGTPESAYGAPGPAYSAPGSAYDAPGSAYGAPGPAYSSPGSAYDAPGSAYGAPGSAYNAPGTAYGSPGIDCDSPTAVVAAPAERFNLISLLFRQGKHTSFFTNMKFVQICN
jgi:hypothetical protein